MPIEDSPFVVHSIHNDCTHGPSIHQSPVAATSRIADSTGQSTEPSRRCVPIHPVRRVWRIVGDISPIHFQFLRHWIRDTEESQPLSDARSTKGISMQDCTGAFVQLRRFCLGVRVRGACHLHEEWLPDQLLPRTESGRWEPCCSRSTHYRHDRWRCRCRAPRTTRPR